VGHTVIGTFRHSGDADLAAAHLREEYALEADELDLIGPAEWDKLTRPAYIGTEGWLIAALSGLGMHEGVGDEDPVAKRWREIPMGGGTLIVARTPDPDVATAMARELRRTGAAQVDILPH
jgi:hypothetical protein